MTKEQEAIKHIKSIIKHTEDGLKKGYYYGERYNYQKQVDDLKIILNILEEKGKIIKEINDYVQQEINYRTEDIEDYIDDDEKENKDIIGELREDREHWKDIIRIMNKEETYIDFERKVEKKLGIKK